MRESHIRAGKQIRTETVDVHERGGQKLQIQQQLERLASLRTVEQAITNSLDSRVTLGVVLDAAVARLHVDAAGILVAGPDRVTLRYACCRGFAISSLPAREVNIGEGLTGRAVLARRTFRVPDLSRFADQELVPPVARQFRSYFATPILARGKIRGVLELYRRAPFEPDAQWIAFLEALGGQAAIAVEHAALFEALERSSNELALAYDATLEGWARALDLRDKQTEGHARRVTETTVALARVMGIGDSDLVHIRRGALLHDIGKMGIPDAILGKPSELTAEEWVIMRRHPNYAFELLSPIPFLRPALDIPYCHHERWNGSGYPRGLRRSEIPLSARIFALTDVWDALRSERPYKAPWSDARTFDFIRKGAGTQFDPRVVDAFMETRLQ